MEVVITPPFTALEVVSTGVETNPLEELLPVESELSSSPQPRRVALTRPRPIPLDPRRALRRLIRARRTPSQ
jgi:hypothetical protein